MSMITSTATVMPPSPDVRVDPEFCQILPSLHAEQLAAMTADLRQHGCLEPLVGWKEEGILLDGHHRRNQCIELGIPYTIQYISLPSREAARDWIWDHHNGRRNWMSAFTQIEHAIKVYKPIYKALAKAQQGHRSDLRQSSDESDVQPIRWDEEVAKRCIPQVSRATVREVEKCRAEANKLSQLGEQGQTAAAEIIEKLRRGELRVGRGCWELAAKHGELRRGNGRDEIPEYINNMGAGFVNNILKVEASPVEILHKLPGDEVTAIVSSPPYNAGKDYGRGAAADDIPYREHLALLSPIAKESYRILRPGGRVILNVDSITSRSTAERAHHYKRPIYADLVRLMEDAGFLFFVDIIWDKGEIGLTKHNWGSYLSASHPAMRPQTEYILVFTKPSADKSDPYRLVPAWDGQRDDIEKVEWAECTRNLWRIPVERRDRGGHPCPYPEELVTRLIKLYTRPDDWIVDPFVGSGTTTAVCQRLGRRWTGIDREDKWCNFALQRTLAESSQSMVAAA